MSEENEAPEVEPEVIETAEVENETIEENETQEVEQDVAPQEPQLELESQQKANAVINRKHKEKMDAIRERDALQQQLNAINAQNQPQEPVVPEFPTDEYEDDYQEKIEEYVEASTRKKLYDAQLASQEAVHIQNQNNYIAEQNRITAENSQKLLQKAAKVQMSESDLTEACKIIGGYNLGPEMSQAISGDESSIEIIKYLSSDHGELDRLSRMTPLQQGLHLQSIKSKAQALKPKSSKAPPPPQDIQGSGADTENGKYPFIKGAKFY